MAPLFVAQFSKNIYGIKIVKSPQHLATMKKAEKNFEKKSKNP